MSRIIILFLLLSFFSKTFSFFPRLPRRFAAISSPSSSTSQDSQSSAQNIRQKSVAKARGRVSRHRSLRYADVLDQKSQTELGEEEIAMILKEFNITDDILGPANGDSSKDFFESMLLRRKKERRTVMEAKVDFYSDYRTPILPQYKTFISEFLTVLLLQVEDARYEYDALHAFGICTHYYTIMKGYPLEDEIDPIFNSISKALRFDPVKLREDAKRVLSFVLPSTVSAEELLNTDEGDLAPIFHRVRENRFFKYCDTWGVGLARILELKGVEPTMTSFEQVCRTLKHVYASRLLDSWVEFSSDQLKMQGVEAMQKQILIREKRRAADRLEEKAVLVEQEKKKILDLNIAIREKKRGELIKSLQFMKENARSQSEVEEINQQLNELQTANNSTFFKFQSAEMDESSSKLN